MYIRIPYFVLGVFIMVSGCHPASTLIKSENPPNILLIMIDDLGKEWVSAYGAEDIETPNFDALAAEGVLFNNVYSMPQCTPSRVTILTGQYPFRHGWVNHWDVPRWGGGAHFDESLNPSLGLEMKKAGYATCIAGKWQIDDFRVEPDALQNNGFDSYCMWTGYESGIVASANRYQDPYLFSEEGAQTHAGKFGPDEFTDFICDFISQERDQPFFIYYPMVLTHTPLINTPDEVADDNLGKHKAMVRYADKLTGRIVRALEAADRRENTVIILTTDNGSTRQISGRYQGRVVHGGKSKVEEPGICIPFIVSWKGVLPAGVISDALIDFSDFFPTFLDLAGITPKPSWEVAGRSQKLDGRSFKEVLVNNAAESNRSWIMSMGGGNHAKLTEDGVQNQYRFRDRVLRNVRYKLYVNSHREPEKFIDLQMDPTEERNLIDSLNTEERRSNFEALFDVVASFPIKDEDPRYQPNPNQEWDVEISAESRIWKK